MPWHFKLWFCFEKWIFIQSAAYVLLSLICLLYWYKHIFTTATITVPKYLQTVGWPVTFSVSCSFMEIVSSALIVDGILALMLGKDSAWHSSNRKKKTNTKKPLHTTVTVCVYIHTYIYMYIHFIYILYMCIYIYFFNVRGGNLLLGTCWFCHEWTVFDATREADWKARVQDSSLVNLRGIQ